MVDHFRMFLETREPTAKLIGLLRRHTGKGLNDIRQAIMAGQPILDEKPHHNDYAKFCTRTAALVNDLEANGIRYTVELDGYLEGPQYLQNLFAATAQVILHPRSDAGEMHATLSGEELQSRLMTMNGPDGRAAHNAYQDLAQRAKDGDVSALETLISYARSGKYNHIREFITSDLAHSAAARDTILLPFFKEGFGDRVRGYWSVLGYIRVAEADAYRDLVDLVLDAGVPLCQRAHAAKCLAQHSGQQFDREAPSDPQGWSEQHIRTMEIRAWLDSGCPAGPGYDKPIRDRALDFPTTPFERLVAKLDRKLAKYREQHQDPANPTGWLSPASSRDLEAIKERWRLPAVYLDFLTRFSPLRANIDSEMFAGGLALFGAADLITGQDGYLESSVLKRRLDEWPAHLVVIGADGGDPYVLDLSGADGDDAPILMAFHGQGRWDFQPAADSFKEFIELMVE
jgi:hypothetical protein